MAISVNFNLSNDFMLSYNSNAQIQRRNFKATDWDKFTQKLGEKYTSSVPENRNLSIDEIDREIQLITKVITETIEEVVPKFTIHRTNSIDKYINKKILQLQSKRRKVVNILHKLHRLFPTAQSPLIRLAKKTLKNISYCLRCEFKQSAEDHWGKLLRTIDHRKVDSFFPKINLLLRPKQPSNIDTIYVDIDDTSLLMRSNCDLRNAPIDNNRYRFVDPKDKLNIIGAHYEKVNSPENLNFNSPLKNIVNSSAQDIKSDLESKRRSGLTITSFTDNNNASFPTLDMELKPFCSPYSVHFILKRLPNKTSSGLDNIPPIVLKFLPGNIIVALAIIFNNCFNW